MAKGGFAKCLLISVNLGILLIGLGFFLTGVILRFAAQSVNGYVDLESLANRIPEFAESVGLAEVNDGDVSGDVKRFTGFEAIGNVFIAVGAFVMVTGVLGMCGACCTNKCMLITYVIVVCVGVLGQAAIIIAFATNLYIDNAEDYLQETLEKDYKGIDDYDITSILWNYVMIGYECCGMEDGSDFEDAKKWVNMRMIEVSDAGNETDEVTLQYPVACCKTKGSFPDKIKAKNESCALYPTEQNNNFDTGCWSKLKDDIKDQLFISSIVAGVLLLIQVICAICAICILSKQRHENYQ